MSDFILEAEYTTAVETQARQIGNHSIRTLGNSSSQAKILEGYAISIEQQADVHLEGFPNLVRLQGDIVKSIRDARESAEKYRTKILPGSIQTVADIDHYVNLEKGFVQAMRNTAEDKQRVDRLLGLLEANCAKFGDQARNHQQSFAALSTSLSGTARNFSRHCNDLNAAVKGDHGVLETLRSNISSVDQQIAGAIAGEVLGGLTIIGGGLLIAAGTISAFMTAGTSIPLAVAGVGVVGIGLAEVGGSTVGLYNAYNRKNELLVLQSTLTAEVKYALGLESGFNLIQSSASAGATAAQEMANSWTEMALHIKSLRESVNTGRIEKDDATKEMLLYAAESDSDSVKKSVEHIQQQLDGSIEKLPQGQTVVEFMKREMVNHHIAPTYV